MSKTLYNAAAANMRFFGSDGGTYQADGSGTIVVPDQQYSAFIGLGFSPNPAGGGGASWGGILGTLSNQTDLNSALGLKADSSAMTSALALKADASAVTSALALKQDISGLGTAAFQATSAFASPASVTAAIAAAVGAAAVNSQSVNYTGVLADAGAILFHPSSDANARTFTIPANASVAYAVGTQLVFINMSANALSIAITTDTMNLAGAGTTGTRTLAQYGIATATKLTSTLWIISGVNLT